MCNFTFTIYFHCPKSAKECVKRYNYANIVLCSICENKIYHHQRMLVSLVLSYYVYYWCRNGAHLSAVGLQHGQEHISHSLIRDQHSWSSSPLSSTHSLSLTHFITLSLSIQPVFFYPYFLIKPVPSYLFLQKKEKKMAVTLKQKS